jgi:hypothetical protein
MQLTPQTDEGWARFGLIVLGTLVLGFSICIAQCGGTWFAGRALGDWINDCCLLTTAALGAYSVGLLYRGRTFLAFLGLVVFTIGALVNLPTL